MEYWIVDPKKQRVEIHILKEGKYKLHQRGEKTDKIQSSLLEGFGIELQEIFKQN
jgi:Uma2 family endonuclease